MDWSTAEPMIGSANRLWRVGDEVVKELVHDAPEDHERRVAAAAFERHVFESGLVAMAEPRPGDVERTVGSRGVELTVRRHRFLVGEPPTTDRAAEAGAQLAVVQRLGASWSTAPPRPLHRWEVDPFEVAARLGIDAGLLRAAMAIVDAAPQGEWVFSHVDHKPANCLVVDGRLALLDWDECGHVHPRLEAIEAALRWGLDREREPFAAFLEAHGTRGPLVPGDFAKHASAHLGWFSYQGRRSLGEWPTDTAADRADAERHVDSTVATLRAMAESVEGWCAWA